MLTRSNTDEENRADRVEAEKEEQLKKAKKGENEWEEDLASDSESIVSTPPVPRTLRSWP